MATLIDFYLAHYLQCLLSCKSYFIDCSSAELDHQTSNVILSNLNLPLMPSNRHCDCHILSKDQNFKKVGQAWLRRLFIFLFPLLAVD